MANSQQRVSTIEFSGPFFQLHGCWGSSNQQVMLEHVLFAMHKRCFCSIIPNNCRGQRKSSITRSGALRGRAERSRLDSSRRPSTVSVQEYYKVNTGQSGNNIGQFRVEWSTRFASGQLLNTARNRCIDKICTRVSINIVKLTRDWMTETAQRECWNNNEL